MKYKVGDRVINKIYGKGTIIGIRDDYCRDFLIEFDEENKNLHDGDNYSIVVSGKNTGK